MNKMTEKGSFSIQSYIDNNRNKIDESLVSLRLMKEVDDFLELNEITHREFANNLGYTESFVSQLMSGVKKLNASFINKLEKKYDLEIGFKIISRSPKKYSWQMANVQIQDMFTLKSSHESIKIDLEIMNLKENEGVYTIDNSDTSSYQVDLNTSLI